MAESRRRRRSSVSESELSDDEKESTNAESPRKPRDSECESEAGTEEVSEYESYQEGEYETEEETEETEYEEESIVIEEGEDGEYIEEERQSGDGEEQPDGTGENLDDDEDAKNPQYIPRKGAFYEHDNRLGEEELEKQIEAEKKGEKKLWKDEGKWLHDRFRQDQQAPKGREELIAMYGFDIRDSDRPPEGPKFSRRGARGKRGAPRQLGEFIDDRKDYQEGPREYRPRNYNNRDRYDSENQGSYGENRGGNYRENHSNYRENRGNYRENRGNYRENQGNYRENQGNYRENQGNYRENQGNYRENQSNYRENQGNYRDGPRDYKNRDRGDANWDGPRRRGKPRGAGQGVGTAEIVVIEDRRTEEERMYEDGFGREFRGREFSRAGPRGRGSRGGQRGGTGRVGPPRGGGGGGKNYSDLRHNQRSASPPFSRPSPPPQQRMTPPQKQEIQSAVYEKRPERSEEGERDERETTPTNSQGENNQQQEKKSYQRDRRANAKDKGPPSHGEQGNYENDYPKPQRQDSNPNAQRNYNTYTSNNQGGNKIPYAPANIPPRLQNQAQNYNQGGAKGSSSADLGQNRPKRYSSQRQRPPNEGVPGESVPGNQMQRPPGQYYNPVEAEGIKFSANAPVFKPRGQPPQVYAHHNRMPTSEHQGGPRPMPPPMPGAVVNTPAHTIATFPPQTNFPPQQRVPFSLPPTSAIQSPPRMFSPTVTAAIPATGVTVATAGTIMQPAAYIAAPPIMSYPSGPPPPHPPPPHGPMPGPPPPPHGFQIPPGPPIPIQNYPPTTNPTNEMGVRIKGGTTYFNPELQQQHSPSRSPVRRPKAAIPIVNPEDLKTSGEEDEEYLEVYEEDGQTVVRGGEYAGQEYVEYYDDQNYPDDDEQSYEDDERKPSSEPVESNDESVKERLSCSNEEKETVSSEVVDQVVHEVQEVPQDVKEVSNISHQVQDAKQEAAEVSNVSHQVGKEEVMEISSESHPVQDVEQEAAEVSNLSHPVQEIKQAATDVLKVSQQVQDVEQEAAEVSNVSHQVQDVKQEAVEVSNVSHQDIKQKAMEVSDLSPTEEVREKLESLNVVEDVSKTKREVTDTMNESVEKRGEGLTERGVDTTVTEVVVTKADEPEEFSEALSEVQAKNSNTLSPKHGTESADALSSHSDEECFHDTQETAESETATSNPKEVTDISVETIKKESLKVSTENLETVEKEQSTS